MSHEATYPIPPLTFPPPPPVVNPSAAGLFSRLPVNTRPVGPRRPLPTPSVAMGYGYDSRHAELRLDKVALMALRAKMDQLMEAIRIKEYALGILPNPHSPTYELPMASEADLSRTTARVAEVERVAEDRANVAEADAEVMRRWIIVLEDQINWLTDHMAM